MRRSMRLAAAFAACVSFSAMAAAQEEGYRTPPAAVADIVTRAPSPSVSVSPGGDLLLLIEREALPSVADLAKPMEKLAGLRLDAATNDRHRTRTAVGLSLQTIASGETYTDYGVNDFTMVEQDALSTFSIDVDTASYTLARRKLEEGQPFSVTGPQADISADNKWTGAAYFAGKGVIAARGEKVVVGDSIKDRAVVASVGDPVEILSHLKEGWNTYRIIASGNQVIQFINGVMTCDYTMSGPDAPQAGLIALQLHEGAPMEVPLWISKRFKELGREDSDWDKFRG